MRRAPPTLLLLTTWLAVAATAAAPPVAHAASSRPSAAPASAPAQRRRYMTFAGGGPRGRIDVHMPHWTNAQHHRRQYDTQLQLTTLKAPPATTSKRRITTAAPALPSHLTIGTDRRAAPTLSVSILKTTMKTTLPIAVIWYKFTTLAAPKSKSSYEDIKKTERPTPRPPYTATQDSRLTSIFVLKYKPRTNTALTNVSDASHRTESSRSTLSDQILKRIRDRLQGKVGNKNFTNLARDSQNQRIPEMITRSDKKFGSYKFESYGRASSFLYSERVPIFRNGSKPVVIRYTPTIGMKISDYLKKYNFSKFSTADETTKSDLKLNVTQSYLYVINFTSTFRRPRFLIGNPVAKQESTANIGNPSNETRAITANIPRHILANIFDTKTGETQQLQFLNNTKTKYFSTEREPTNEEFLSTKKETYTNDAYSMKAKDISDMSKHSTERVVISAMKLVQSGNRTDGNRTSEFRWRYTGGGGKAVTATNASGKAMVHNDKRDLLRHLRAALDAIRAHARAIAMLAEARSLRADTAQLEYY